MLNLGKVKIKNNNSYSDCQSKYQNDDYGQIYNFILKDNDDLHVQKYLLIQIMLMI
jgi:hypothetical protein